MKSVEKDMVTIWQDWDNATIEDQERFHSYLNPALVINGELIDDPGKGIGRTGPLGKNIPLSDLW